MRTLWAGHRQEDAGRLHALIPGRGEVPPAFENVHLEMFRRFQNAYYDLYNNGGCNWGYYREDYRSVAAFYGVKAHGLKVLTDGICYSAGFEPLESLGVMIIDAALKEQFP